MQQSRLDIALTAPEYGLGFTVQPNPRPGAAAGYYSVFDYTYNIAGATTGNTVLDTFNRVVANGWGSADTGQTWAIGGGAASNYSVNTTTGGPAGIINLPTNDGIVRRTVLGAFTLPDVNVSAKMFVNQIMTGGLAGSGLTARDTGTGSNLYHARLIWGLAGALSVQLTVVVGGVETTLATVAVGTYVPFGYWWLRFNLVGTTIQVKAWQDQTVEPSNYQITVTDTSLTTGGVGTRTFRTAGNTNVAPSFVYDTYTIGSLFTDSLRAIYFWPQRFGESWQVTTVSVNDTSQGQVPGVFIMRGLIRPETAFNLSAITYPHQVPPLLATSNLVDSTANGTNDVDNLENPLNLSSGEYFTILFAASQYPAPGTVQTSTVYATGTVFR